MNIEVQLAWVLSVLLLSVRIGVFFFNTPLDALGYTPAKVKLLIILGLSSAIVTGLDIQLDSVPSGAWQLVGVVFNEMVIGLAMVLAVYALFAALSIAGRILDFQSGFGAANLFNPATNNQDPLIGTVFVMAGAVWFFLSDTYLLVIKALALTIEVWPPGKGMSLTDLDAPLYVMGMMFSYGILVAAPVLIVLYLVDTGVAVMARSMPQINVYFLFLPLKIGVTLVLTGFTLRYLAPVLEQMSSMMESYWLKLMT